MGTDWRDVAAGTGSHAAKNLYDYDDSKRTKSERDRHNWLGGDAHTSAGRRDYGTTPRPP